MSVKNFRVALAWVIFVAVFFVILEGVASVLLGRLLTTVGLGVMFGVVSYLAFGRKK